MIQRPTLLRTGERLEPIGLEVTLSADALHTAKITIADDPGVRVHDLLEIFTVQGSAGIFRVTDRAKRYGGEITLEVRGALDTLSDDVYPGTTALTGTPTAVLTDILSKQSTARWQLGTVAMTGTVKISNSYSNLFELAEAVRTDKSGYWWVFDYTTTPWTVSLAAMPSTTAAEFRLGRNVASATIDLSDNDLFTRLYMTVSTDSASTLYTYDNAAAQATWGIISRTIDVDAEEVSDPATTGAAILAEHAQPVAYITLDGYDLKRLTGDAFDRITLGSLCRVVLPDFEDTFSERVTQIQWPDALGEPEKITVSLANNLTPFRDQLKIIQRTGSGAARQAEENARELVIHRADIDKTDERILLWATEEEWDDLAEQYVVTQKSGLEITSDAITAEATARANGDTTLSGQIQVEAGKISQIVTAVGDNGQVTAASIVTAINNGGSSVTIDADHIILSGTTTLKGSLSITSGELTSSYPISTTSYLKATSLTLSDNSAASITPEDIATMIIKAEVDTATNTLKLWKRGDSSPSITFSKAVAPTIGGSWNGSGTYTITSSPAAASGSKTSIAPTVRLNGSGGATFSAEMLNDDASPTVERSATGYLHQNGGTMGVYTSYESGTYSGIIASVSISGYHPNTRTDAANNLTQVNAVSTSQATQMYAYVNGTLTSMGTGFWYKRSTHMTPTTYYY